VRLSKSASITVAIASVALAVGLFAWAHAVAQQELPLAEMALQKDELPGSYRILNASPTTFQDVSQPINSANSVSFRVHPFLEAYKVYALAGQAEIGQYLYRYQDATQAEEQAQTLITYALQDPKSQPMQPVLVDDGSMGSPGVAGQTIRFTSSETGAVYYWFIDVQGRTLILLVVGGPENEHTRMTFEALKAQIQQR
jgi:hypothetical protein